jgi:hypothetical protein
VRIRLTSYLDAAAIAHLDDFGAVTIPLNAPDADGEMRPNCRAKSELESRWAALLAAFLPSTQDEETARRVTWWA